MRPFSDEDIEQLKTTPYVKPEPLTIPAILILIIFFPVGLCYLVRKQTPEYMLSRCKTDQEREALFSYLKTAPDVCENNSTDTFMSIPKRDNCASKSVFSLMGPWSCVPGTYGYKLKHGVRR